MFTPDTGQARLASCWPQNRVHGPVCLHSRSSKFVKSVCLSSWTDPGGSICSLILLLNLLTKLGRAQQDDWERD
eukprot:scaffold147119_cov16-Tisochrysis_lutea.AAC.1